MSSLLRSWNHRVALRFPVFNPSTGGSAGINPISGCTTPDDKYLPGRGVLQPSHEYVMALSANLEHPGLWCLLWRLAKDDVIQDIADEGCYSFGWRLLQTWQSQPAIRRGFCGAERLAQLVWGRWARFLLLDDEALPWHGTLRALDGCSSSDRLPQLPLCLGWALLSLATAGSLQCVMGEGPSPNWVQMVLDHPLMYPRLDERQLLLWRKYGLAMLMDCTSYSMLVDQLLTLITTYRACGHHIVLYDWLAALEAAFCCQGFCLPPTLEVILYRFASFVSSYPPGVWVAPSAYGARKLPLATSFVGPRLCAA